MNPHRAAAFSAGVLFVVATFTSIAGTSLSRGLLADADRLTAISANVSHMTAGALLELIVSFTMTIRLSRACDEADVKPLPVCG